MELNTIKNNQTWGQAAASLNENFSKVRTDMEKVKNATTRNKGYFKTVEALETAFPTASEGDKAYVGGTYPYTVYNYIGGVWTTDGATGGDESVNLGDYYTKEDTDTLIKESEEALKKDIENLTVGGVSFATSEKLGGVKAKPATEKDTQEVHITGDGFLVTEPTTGGEGEGGVTGVKGNAETTYRKGNVNITPANIGLGNVDNTADSDKSVKYATSAGSATKAAQDGNGNVIAETYATKTEMSSVEGIANEAKGKADSAETSSDEALNIANEAKTVANIAKNAVATLEGLSNTTTAQETLAAQVVQIEENKQNVSKLERDIEESQGYTNKDFSIEDEKGNSIVEFSNGHIRTKNFDSSIARPEEGYTDNDFSIEDEKGNSIAEFSNGHIRTKNFDSSVIKQATQYPYKDCINAFVDMMNKFVYDYGMKNTLFVNASGMGTYRDEEPEGDRNTSCPKDFMRLAACATQTDIMKYWNIQDYSVEVGGSNARTITGTCVYSTSEIIQNAGYHIIGGKTGSWSKNGNLTNNITLVVKSKINDDWLVGTIMKADTSIDRDIPIRDLFDWLEAKRQDSSTPDPTLQCEYACAGVVPKNNPIGFRLYDFSVVEKNSETNCLPASMAKIMTGIVALHFCKGNEILTVEATDMRGGSGDEVFVGDEFSLWDALVVMHLSSSNTLATAVSRFVGNIILNNK